MNTNERIKIFKSLMGQVFGKEDISGANVDKYHYEINFLPEYGVKVTHND